MKMVLSVENQQTLSSACKKENKEDPLPIQIPASKNNYDAILFK